MAATHAGRADVRRPQFNPWLVAVVALGAALVTLGAWVVVDQTRGREQIAARLQYLMDAGLRMKTVGAPIQMGREHPSVGEDRHRLVAARQADGPVALRERHVRRDADRVSVKIGPPATTEESRA